MCDLVQPELFTEKLRWKIKENNAVLKALGAETVSFKEVNDAYLGAAGKAAAIRGNTVVYLHEALKAGSEILFEGAQGTHWISITAQHAMRGPLPSRRPAAPAPAPACRRTAWIA